MSSSATHRALTPVAVGLRAIRGGGVLVAVAAEAGEPRVILSTFLATAAENDRLAYEPYHVAAEMMRGSSGGGQVEAEVAAAVAEARARQARLAAEGLDRIMVRLRDAGCEPVAAALLINRAGWIGDLLAYSLGATEHPAVAEGLAVREALRAAFAVCGMAWVEVDEKSLQASAADVLARGPDAIDETLRALGATAGKPWRKEQKAACLAAWAILAGR